MTGTGPDGGVPPVAGSAADTTATLSPGAVRVPVAVPPPETVAAKGRKVKPPKPKKPAWRVALEWVVLIAVALGIALLIKSFLFQAFYIPSESMKPTLNVGDRVLVNKLSYDLHDVNRGDIVVFEAPPRAQSGGIEDLVKRVIGRPGETVTADDSGTVLIDGRPLHEPYLPTGTVSRFNDVPPGCGTPSNGQAGCVVPPGHVFMMGDNREASKDSRVFGPIDEETIVGRVFVRIWPLSDLGFL
ncbi:MAG TPA: signal peptidase I [Acidimicrobiia bacterium]